MTLRVGFVGVGQMGSAMARRVLAAGFPVIAADVRREALQALEEAGARAAGSPAEVAQASDVVCVVVLDDAQARDVFRGAGGLLSAASPERVVAIHSTIRVDTVRELAEEAARSGLALVDAGVTGHTRGADRGELAVMVGGDERAFERCRPVFETYGGLVLRMGGLGAGMQAKLARQTLNFLQAAAAYEAMHLAERSGVDLAALARIVRYSDRHANLVPLFLGRPSVEPADERREAGRGWLAIARATLPLARKDLEAALALAERLDTELPVARAALEQMPRVWGVR